MQGVLKMQALGIHTGVDPAAGQQRLGIRGKAEKTAGVSKIERLDAETVARAEQLLFGRIPDREGKHAVQVPGAVLAPLAVGLEDHLGVAAGHKGMTFLLQIGAQLSVVVDGAVEHQ